MNSLKSSITILIVIFSTVIYSQKSSNTDSKLLIDKQTNCQLRYYYYPNLQAYFDNLKNVFYYQDKGSWYTAQTLPKNYGGYSLYKMNYVTITDYDDEQPYLLLNNHKKLYPYNYKSVKM